jgi:hypothetical protein
MLSVDRGHCVACCQRDEVIAPPSEDWDRGNKKRTDATLGKRREGRVDVVFVARVHDMNLPS